MEFWNDLVTKGSWEVLLHLRKMPLRFTLIGGWAAYLWARLQKSQDIDIVLHDHAGLAHLGEQFSLKKNPSLRKYEILIGDVSVDIYVPYFSRLPIPPEDISQYGTSMEGVTVVRPEPLLILKQGAERDRRESLKGQKDRVDILSLLLHVEMDWPLYLRLLERYSLESYLGELMRIPQGFDEPRYLGLNPREWKLRRQRLAEELRGLRIGA